MGLGLGLNTI